MRVLSVILSFSVFLSIAPAQELSQAELSKTIKNAAARAQAAKRYSMEGTLVLEGQQGKNAARTLSTAKFKLASGPEGKSFLRIEAEEKDEYQLISNGQKSWAYVPKLKQFTEEEGAPLDSEETGGDSDNERDLAETFTRMVVPGLANMFKNAESADQNGVAPVKFEGRKDRWPLLRVMSKEDPEDGRTYIEMAVQPETLDIGHVVWANTRTRNGERTLFRMTLELSSFRWDDAVPDSTFEFLPPKNAKRVDAVPIPGQTGSLLLNKPAPDFELKTLEGEKVRLSDLRGKVVLLNFWASWCGPCRRELPGLADIYDRLSKKGLYVYGINDEGKSVAKEYSKEAVLSFPTLDDSSRKAHSLYRIRSIPTVFIIDANGQVVRFLSGSRSKEDLLAVLKGVGF
ncbi:redoxin domain-containing protein [Paludibaculum fermentans]|uniref:Redoxin domain-containing protein n=1 Tax=Paludibaculum fermentans TaxID=1473598 RepID=A0A7S7NQZ2_PALFE|nr:redoxin domain-containing protein [Paludibaculum fermentans]QOY88138.1 redoxin domain-containing protein [Paludibaculum fermentans]